MFEVRIDSQWIAVDASELARLLLSGGVDCSAHARDLARSEETGPLMHHLRGDHFEAISTELLDRLQTMYVPDEFAPEPRVLGERIGELCRCEWSDDIVSGRVRWAAGWIEELTGSFASAIRRYTEYLSLPASMTEPQLQCLALNNRGVLKLRGGQADGLVDLARAAIVVNPEKAVLRELEGIRARESRLPAACFNLLNLINLAFRSDALRDDVDRILIGYMVRLPQRIRESWLGSDPRKEEPKANGQSRSPDDAGVDESAPVEPLSHSKPEDEDGEWLPGELESRLLILRGGHFARLNRLCSNLAAAEALSVASGPPPDRRDPEAVRRCVADQLKLWAADVPMELAGELNRPEQSALEIAEAASLLYAHQVPRSLSPQKGSLDWARRQVEETLTRAEEYLADDEFALARSAVESVREALRGLEEQPQVRALQNRTTDVLQTIDERQRTYEQLRLDEAFRKLQEDADEFSLTTDLYAARTHARELKQQIERLDIEMRRVWGRGSARLTDHLVERIDKHVGHLEREDLESLLRGPIRTLRNNWPSDWTQPVSQAAYEALERCCAADPQGKVEAWDARRLQLDAHQAEHLFRRVLCEVCAGRVDWNQARDLIGRALVLDPAIAAAAAPVFCFLSLPPMVPTGDLAGIEQELSEVVTALLYKEPLDARGAWSQTVRADLVQRACLFLRRLCRAFPSASADVVEFWRQLSTGFEAAIAIAHPSLIGEVELMIEACLEASPTIAAGQAASKDPRNPLRLLLAQCASLKELGLGEDILNSPPPSDGAADHFRAALEGGMPGREHLRRASVGLYLSELGAEDSLPEQRRILNAIDAWVDQRSELECAELRLGEVSRAIDRLRSQTPTHPVPGDSGQAGATQPDEHNDETRPVDGQSNGDDETTD